MTDDLGVRAGSREPSPAVLAVPASIPDAAWRTDAPPFGASPIWQFVLVQGEEYHSGTTWFREGWGLATIRVAHAEDNYCGYRRSDIEAICENHGIGFEMGPRIVGWLPACAPAPYFGERKPALPLREDGEWSAKAIEARRAETPAAPSQDESAVGEANSPSLHSDNTPQDSPNE